MLPIEGMVLLVGVDRLMADSPRHHQPDWQWRRNHRHFQLEGEFDKQRANEVLNSPHAIFPEHLPISVSPAKLR